MIPTIDEPANLVVCIPTYRRVPQLVSLLRALGRQTAVERFDILIGNNDSRDLRTYAELNASGLPPYMVIDVTTRGVTAVRNAMVSTALAREHVQWIACLDDDQEPADDWLARLLAAGRKFDADLVGGPVARIAQARTFWSQGAADTSYLPTIAGPTTTLNEAGNLLLSARFLRTLDRPPFSMEFGRTGGEDYEFFLCARSRGARIVWAPDAHVAEPLSHDRLTMRSFAWRFYSIAAYQARADRRHLGLRYVVGSIASQCLKAPFALVRSLVRERSLRSAVGVVIQYASSIAGRVVGLAGARAERYGGDAGDRAIRR